MKLTCTQQDVSRALATVGHAVSRRNTLPILSTILFTTEEQMLQLAASDRDGLTITCRIKATIEEPGSVALPAKLLTDYIASLQGPQVSFSTRENAYECHISCGRSSATIQGMDPAEFPLIPRVEEGLSPLVMDSALLKEIIDQVSFAAARDDDSRPIFTGIYIVVGDERLTSVAADSFRLAVRRLPILEEHSGKLLVPARTMELLARVLPGEGAVEMRVTPTGNQVMFHTSNIDFLAVLLEGVYADYEAVLPKTYCTRAIVKRQELAAAVKEVVPFAHDGGNRVKVTIRGRNCRDGEPETLTLEASAEQMGHNVSVISATVTGDEQQEILLNVKYLSDVLTVLDMPEIAVEVSSPLRPVALKPACGPTDYHYVIMPMFNEASVSQSASSAASQESPSVSAAR